MGVYRSGDVGILRVDLGSCSEPLGLFLVRGAVSLVWFRGCGWGSKETPVFPVRASKAEDLVRAEYEGRATPRFLGLDGPQVSSGFFSLLVSGG